MQYVLVRGDLARTLKWPSGAVLAQACHACVAVTHVFYSDPNTQAYLEDLGNMHKVVLEVSGRRRLSILFRTRPRTFIDVIPADGRL